MWLSGLCRFENGEKFEFSVRLEVEAPLIGVEPSPEQLVPKLPPSFYKLLSAGFWRVIGARVDSESEKTIRLAVERFGDQFPLPERPADFATPASAMQNPCRAFVTLVLDD